MTLPHALQNLQRSSCETVEQNLSERFNLVWFSQMRDWKIISANPELVPQFLDALAEPTLSDDERFSLMELTVASLDELLQIDKNGDAYWQDLSALLRAHPHVYASTMLAWAKPALEGRDNGERLRMSGRMAEVWTQLLPELMAKHAFQ